MGRFLQEARSRGMIFADPAEVQTVRGANSMQIKDFFDRAVIAGCEFLLCIHSDGPNGDLPHGMFKHGVGNYR